MYLVISILFGLLCGIIAHAVAKSKGYEGNAFFWAGALFGPIGIFVAVFYRKPAIVLMPHEIEDNEGRICPHCRSRIPLDAAVCRYCQRDSDMSRPEIAPPRAAR